MDDAVLRLCDAVVAMGTCCAPALLGGRELQHSWGLLWLGRLLRLLLGQQHVREHLLELLSGIVAAWGLVLGLVEARGHWLHLLVRSRHSDP